jgi:hypothetical protein
MPHHRSTRPALLILLILCAVFATSGRAQHEEWWNNAWPRRVLLAPAGRQQHPDADWAVYRAHLPIGANPAGRDIVVVGPDGAPVPFDLVDSSAEGNHLLAFRAPDPRARYAVYYGNPDPPALRRRSVGQGLWRATFAIPDGLDSSRWEDVAEALRTADRYGIGPADSIHGGHNPHGPQENYMTAYTGYLRIEKPGTYRFAALNEHTCYLVINDEVVDKMVGRQGLGRVRRPRGGGRVELEAGLHEVLFVAFSYGWAMRHAMAWAPPGQDHLELAPASVFPGPVHMNKLRTQAVSGPCADFRIIPRSYCESGGAQMVSVLFRYDGTPGPRAVRSYRWSFGDGLTSRAPEPEHVYLRPGLYTVRLAVTTQDGERASVAKRVQVDPVWLDQDFRRPKLNAFWEATSAYDVKVLDTDSLLGAWRFWQSIERAEAATNALLVLSDRHRDLSRDDRYAVAMAMAQHHQQTEPDPEKAEQWLRAALATTDADDPARRWEARFALADHFFYYERDPARARMEYEKLRIDYPRADPAARRLALVRIGDTYRNQAREQEARKRYRQAEEDPRYRPQQSRALVLGATLHEVQAYLAREEGEQALKELEELLWHFPTLRLDGRTTLLRCRAALQQQHWAEAKKHADAYIAFSQDPNYLPTVHKAAARACEALGLQDEAAEHGRTIREKFPESPEAQEAGEANGTGGQAGEEGE